MVEVQFVQCTGRFLMTSSALVAFYCEDSRQPALFTGLMCSVQFLVSDLVSQIAGKESPQKKGVNNSRRHSFKMF